MDGLVRRRLLSACTRTRISCNGHFFLCTCQNNDKALLELTAIERHEPAMLTLKLCTHPCCRVTEDVALRIVSELHRGFKSVANVGGYGHVKFYALMPHGKKQGVLQSLSTMPAQNMCCTRS